MLTVNAGQHAEPYAVRIGYVSEGRTEFPAINAARLGLAAVILEQVRTSTPLVWVILPISFGALSFAGAISAYRAKQAGHVGVKLSPGGEPGR